MRLWEALTSRTGRGSLRVWDGTAFVQTPWRDVAAEATGIAATLRRLGVRPGRNVAALLTNTPATVPGLLGVWLAGGTIASLPIPTPGMDIEEYSRRIGALVAKLDAPLALTDEWLQPLLPASPPSRSWESLRDAGTRPVPYTATPPGEDEPAYIQFSSGSTALPKGCVLTPRAIAAQLEVIRGLSASRPGEDVVSSWLPLSHDMGMFGCLLFSWFHDHRLVLSPPERFLMTPRTWFADMATYGATLTACTNTAVHLATRVQRSTPLPGPLRLRAGIVGAERVDAATLRRAVRTFGPYGLSPTALVPAYGLAEATLAVSASRLGAEPSAVTVDGIRLAAGEVVDAAPDDPAAVPIVSTGPPCRGVTVSLDEPARLSQIRVTSPSLALGYFADEERTRAVFTPEGLRTGDLGFLRDGELYVVGRTDDLLSVAGRNVYAREIESGIDAHESLRRGCVVLVDVPDGGRSELVLLAELKHLDADHENVADHAAQVVMDKAGVALDRCLFLPKGALPKTPSGKIQRFQCRRLLEQRALEPVAQVVLAGG